MKYAVDELSVQADLRSKPSEAGRNYGIIDRD